MLGAVIVADGPFGLRLPAVSHSLVVCCSSVCAPSVELQIHEVTVPLSREFEEIKESFLGIMKVALARLVSTHATTETNPEKLHAMMLLQLKESLPKYEQAWGGLDGCLGTRGGMGVGGWARGASVGAHAPKTG